MGAFEDLNDNVIKLAECVIQLTDKVIALEEKVENGGKVIWTRKELAEYLDDSLVVADYYIHQPDFPKDTGGTKRKTFFASRMLLSISEKKQMKTPIYRRFRLFLLQKVIMQRVRNRLYM